METVPATRLRVERQQHLPTSRDEAWLALQSLIPEAEWDESAEVFSALESIYRCVMAGLPAWLPSFDHRLQAVQL